MPTVFRQGPYRFLFYPSDGDELPHVHVERDENFVKFWIDPIEQSTSRGFRRPEIRRIRRIVESNQGLLIAAWNEFFNG
jgi:hypothetical protein